MMNALPGGMLLSVSAPSSFWLALSLIAGYLPVASPRPTSEFLRRQSDNNNGASSSSGSGVSMNIWLPILIIAVVFAVLTLITCIRRCAYRESGAAASSNAQSQPAGQAPTTRPGRRRRPARTPSQISTKSLPPYMKEPGDQELVIFKGPSDMDDEPMPVLNEDDEHPESGLRNLPSDDVESHGTMLGDTSVTNFIHNASTDVLVRRSMDIASLGTSADSHESHAELLPAHARQASEIPLEEAPPYFEVVGQDVPETSLSNPPPPEPSIQNNVPGDRRSRFSFLLNPFGGSSRHPPVSNYNRIATPDHGGSSISLASTTSGHRRNRSASGSGSGHLKLFKGHPMPMTSHSTISLDSISAPLTYTLKRSEFRVPKGGLTPEQIKLITSRDALERFGAPYGPDAVAFSASRTDMVPPPAFESTISNSLGQASMSSVDLHTSSDDGPSRESSGSPTPDAAAVSEGGQTTSDSAVPGTSTLSPSGFEGDSRSSSLSPPSSYNPPRAESRTSSRTSFQTAVSELSPPTTPITARPVIGRPLSH